MISGVNNLVNIGTFSQKFAVHRLNPPSFRSFYNATTHHMASNAARQWDHVTTVRGAAELPCSLQVLPTTGDLHRPLAAFRIQHALDRGVLPLLTAVLSGAPPRDHQCALRVQGAGCRCGSEPPWRRLLAENIQQIKELVQDRFMAHPEGPAVTRHTRAVTRQGQQSGAHSAERAFQRAKSASRNV